MVKSRVKSEFTLQHYFLFVILAGVLFLMYSMMRPYLNSIILGILLSFLFMPLNNKFLIYTKGKKNLSAFFSSLTLAFLVVLPVAFVILNVLFQGINSFEGIYKWFASADFDSLSMELDSRLELLKDTFPFISSILPDSNFSNGDLEKQILSFFSASLKWLMGQGSRFLGSTLNLGASFFLMMVVFFVMIRDQEKLIDSCLHLIPLKLSQERRIIQKTKELFKSVILGNIFTSLAQGIVGGIGFAIAGFAPVFWGASIALVSLVPVVGTALIWIPASIWLFISGRVGMAVFIVIWFLLIVGLLDNFLRPVFIKGEEGMGPITIFFSILGGINIWGLLGLIYGPMVFGTGFVLLYIYRLEFDEYLRYQDEN